MRRHQEAHSSHLDSPDSPIQCCCGHIKVSSVAIREGGSAYRAVGNCAWVPLPTAGVGPGTPPDQVARPKWPDLSVRESSTKENVKSRELHLIY